MNGGTEWLVDASDCRAEALRDLDRLRRLCEQIISQLELRAIGDGIWHSFPPPGGVTGLYLLTESHLACHTYPESGLATFNLYCCRRRPAWPWEEQLRRELGAQSVRIRTVRREADGGEP